MENWAKNTSVYIPVLFFRSPRLDIFSHSIRGSVCRSVHRTVRYLLLVTTKRLNKCVSIRNASAIRPTIGATSVPTSSYHCAFVLMLRSPPALCAYGTIMFFGKQNASIFFIVRAVFVPLYVRCTCALACVSARVRARVRACMHRPKFEMYFVM